MCLTLTELPVLGDHLAVATVALAGVGAIAVYTAALPFTWVLVTLIHIYNQRKESRGSSVEIECDITSQLHFTSRDCSLSKPCLWGSSTVQTFLSDGPEPSQCRAEAAAKAFTVR